MQKVVISGLAEAYTHPRASEAIADPSVLKELHGLYSDALCVEYLAEHPGLENLHAKGGRLRFVFDEVKGKLRITTAYVVPQKLSESDTEKLVQYTRGQWSDGIGSGSFRTYRHNVLSTALAMAILNTEPTRTDLGKYFVDAFPLSATGVDVIWLESDNEDEDLVSDLIKGAEAGHSMAQVELAGRYEGGAGVQLDLGQAFYWMGKAAEQNVPFAVAKVGFCYLDGVGTSRDLAKAVTWLKKGVDLKFPMAMGLLGDLYQEGVGVEKDLEKGFVMYKRGADLGDVVCLKQVGECYLEGKGVTKDLRKALTCYEQCLEQGMPVEAEIEHLRQALKNS